MFNKKIINIVFYKLDNNDEKLACIFYADGTVNSVSFEEGIDACEELVKEYNIKSKDTFQEMINKELVHVLSGKDFNDRFQSFLPAKNVEVQEPVAAAEEVLAASTVLNNSEEQRVEEAFQDAAASIERQIGDIPEPVKAAQNGAQVLEKDKDKGVNPAALPAAVITDQAEEEQQVLEGEGAAVVVPPVPAKAPETAEVVSDGVVKESDGEVDPFADEDEEEVVPLNNNGASVPTDTGAQIVTGDASTDPFEHDGDDKDKGQVQTQGQGQDQQPTDGAPQVDGDIEDKDIVQEGQPEKKNWFQRQFEKIKKSKVGKKVIALGLAAGLITTLSSCSFGRKSLEGQMLNSNLTQTTSTTNNTKDGTLKRLGGLLAGNNAFYRNYSFDQLVEVTESEVQKNAMINLEDTLSGFNEEFASFYQEYGKDVRAALKFDEMIALQMAYNDYSRQDIQAIFNGADIRSADLVRSYKDASLQLMGAYAMENSNHPVDMSGILETKEAQDFYNMYHEAFLAAKEATGQDQLNKVKAFYDMVRRDFPITNEVRTEGISHSENYDKIVPYKLSVTPMIAAAEMIWQNLKVDNTLKDGEIDFLNDLGLCNYAEDTFDRIEVIVLSTEVDKTNPTYDQYRNAIIAMLTEKGFYYVSDEKRELTKLDSFQAAVNGHFNQNTNVSGNGQGGKGGSTSTKTRQETTTRTETTTTTTEEVTRVEKPIPDSIKAQIDAQIAAENEAARLKGQTEAELERQRLQAIEDANAALIAAQVAQDAQDMQNRLNVINSIINNNNADNNVNNDRVINQSDLGHGVVFDANHQDGNGNLNSSVQNITTDPTGDQTGMALPDPNATGAVFDSKAASITYTADTSAANVTLPQTGQPAQGVVENQYQFWVEEGSPEGQDQWTEISGIQIDPEYEGYVNVTTQNNAQLVNNYVEGLAQGAEYGDGYQYVK